MSLIWPTSAGPSVMPMMVWMNSSTDAETARMRTVAMDCATANDGPKNIEARMNIAENVIGTTNAFQTQEIFQNVGSELQAQASGAAFEAPAAGGDAGAAAPSTEEATGDADALSPAESDAQRTLSAPSDDAAESSGAASQLPAERSPWPMVLFTGVALMIAAALLRWILVPRAG